MEKRSLIVYFVRDVNRWFDAFIIAESEEDARAEYSGRKFSIDGVDVDVPAIKDVELIGKPSHAAVECYVRSHLLRALTYPGIFHGTLHRKHGFNPWPAELSVEEYESDGSLLMSLQIHEGEERGLWQQLDSSYTVAKHYRLGQWWSDEDEGEIPLPYPPEPDQAAFEVGARVLVKFVALDQMLIRAGIDPNDCLRELSPGVFRHSVCVWDEGVVDSVSYRDEHWREEKGWYYTVRMVNKDGKPSKRIWQSYDFAYPFYTLRHSSLHSGIPEKRLTVHDPNKVGQLCDVPEKIPCAPKAEVFRLWGPDTDTQ